MPENTSIRLLRGPEERLPALAEGKPAWTTDTHKLYVGSESGNVLIGGVSSVGLTMPALFAVAGSPITSSGAFAVTLATQAANVVFAGPTTGSAAAPTFRALTAADVPAGTGTVTSVALTAPGILSVAGSPITTSGTIALSLATQAANKVWAGPTTGADATPAFRSLVTADLPAGTGTVTSVALSMPSFLTVSGSPVTTSGTLTATLANQSANTALMGPSTGAAAAPTFRALVTADLPAGTGTVTSVALTAPGILSVAGSPVTTSGTLALSLATQSANLVFAGPTSGGAATPTFRSLVTADMPAGSGTVTSVALSLPSFITVSGSPVTTTGTLTGTLATQTANTVFSGPTSGSAAAPTFRAMVAADLPGERGTVPGGRLTTESGVPVSTSDRTSQSTLYYAPYLNDYVRLYNGSAVKEYTFTGRSLALSGLTSGKNYDVFLYDNAGTLTLELSAAWTNDTTQADALAWQSGLGLVKSGAATRLWLGTIRTTGTTTTEDSAAKRFVWNAYNQMPRRLTAIDSGNWTLTSSTSWSQRGTKQVEVVVGGVTAVDLALSIYAFPASGGAGSVSIGRDGTSAMASPGGVSGQANNPGLASIIARLRYVESLGYHYYPWLEVAISANCQFFSINALPDQQYAGLDGWVWG
jgi:hypothetical protein